MDHHLKNIAAGFNKYIRICKYQFDMTTKYFIRLNGNAQIQGLYISNIY